ncbi:MAG: hypothetical protein ACJ0GU_05895 [Gammaproteobacteria bacterium]
MNNPTSKYLNQFNKKKKKFDQFFLNFTKDLTYFKSPEYHFRTRADFGVHYDNSIEFTMIKNGKKYYVKKLKICDIIINDVLQQIKDELNLNTLLREKIFQLNIQVSRSKQILVSMIYHKKLDSNWAEEAKKISKKLDISLVGRSRKQKIVIGSDNINEVYKTKKNEINIDLYEQCFSQPNPHICDEMLSWVESCTESQSNITELHSGQGTFTILFSKLFTNVLSTENSRPSVVALKKNLERNTIKNVSFARMSGLETLEGLLNKRQFRRLKNVNLSLFQGDFLFLDPPRSGIDLDSLELINKSKFKKIIYISCGFEALLSNLKDLSNNYVIKRAAMFDQFPYTDHIESGVLLELKSII